MTIPAPLLFVAAMFLSAHAHLNAVVLGQPVSVSALALIALGTVMALLIVLLLVIRALIRDGLRLRPQWRTVPALCPCSSSPSTPTTTAR